MKGVKRRGYIEVTCFHRIERRKKVNRKYNRREKRREMQKEMKSFNKNRNNNEIKNKNFLGIIIVSTFSQHLFLKSFLLESNHQHNVNHLSHHFSSSMKKYLLDLKISFVLYNGTLHSSNVPRFPWKY